MKKYLLLLTLCIFHSAFAIESLTVLLDWIPNASHAPLLLAEQKKFFQEENLNVKLLGPADPADPPKLVAAGKADIAITYEPQFIQQSNQRLPLMVIGTLINHPLTCLLVLKSSGIHSISDLKGKRIAASVSHVNHIILGTMLKKNGLTLSDVTLINVHYNLLQALLSHQVDAVTGVMRTIEGTQLPLLGYPVQMFFPEKNGVPLYSELIFVANKKHLHDPRFTRFFRALKKSIAYLKTHPEDSFQTVLKAYPELNNANSRNAWYASIPYFADDPTKIDVKQWETFTNFMSPN